MMDPRPDAVDQQSSKLDEFVLVSRRIKKAGRGALTFSPTVRKSSPTANGSFVFASPEFRKAPSKLTAPPAGEPLSKEGGTTSSVQAFSAVLQDHSRL
jgi:hypothetical protein